MELIGNDGSIKSQNTVMNVTKSKIQITVDLTSADSARVDIDNTNFLDLASLNDDSKVKFIKMFGPDTQNITNYFASFSVFYDQYN